MGTCGDCEELQVDFEYQLLGEEPFIVLRTEGWSINDLSDLDFIKDVCVMIGTIS